jgi:glycine hydroxymethyltransferase
MIAPNTLVPELITQERQRQREWIELIASENYPSKTVQQVVWSIFMAKYAEWYPLDSDLNWQKWRYYGWCEIVDKLENETRNLALKMFWLDKATWHVNVQPHSWSNANEAALMSIINLWDKILSFDLSHWGHLSHWMKLNTSGRNYKIKHYWVDKKTKELNYDDIEKIALLF